MPQEPRVDESQQIQHVRDDLVREFASVAPDVVEEQVTQVANGFLEAPVRSFVPMLVRRGARERLLHLD